MYQVPNLFAMGLQAGIVKTVKAVSLSLTIFAQLAFIATYISVYPEFGLFPKFVPEEAIYVETFESRYAKCPAV